jgi:hypothetical protein
MAAELTGNVSFAGDVRVLGATCHARDRHPSAQHVVHDRRRSDVTAAP